jgi:hypothetical protein
MIAGDWLSDSPGQVGVMHATIPTYALRGINAVPADVIVEGEMVCVAERKTGRTLLGVKRGPSSNAPAGVQSDRQTPVQRESAPETMSTGQCCLSYPSSPI